jgi:type IV secretion system protein VirB4
MKHRSARIAPRCERPVADAVPYAAQLSEHVVRTLSGDYLQVFRLGGASFESADDSQLNNWHERLNALWRNLASPNVAIWTHVIRRRVHARLLKVAGEGFAQILQRRYDHRLRQETLMVNELYLSTVYRPTAGAAASLTARLLMQLQRGAAQGGHQEALEFCEKLASTVGASLVRYEPQRLGCYQAQGVWFSSLLEFLGVLINGEAEPMALPTGSLAQAFGTSRLFFGAEAIEYRSATGTRVAGMLGIKDYSMASVTGMFDRLLSAPFSYVLTQSFAFLTRAASEGLLQRQMHRMANAGDFGVSQSAQLRDALDALASNEFVFGDHHCTLQVIVDLEEQVQQPQVDAGLQLRELNERLAQARGLLADTGMSIAREDLGLEAAFWAQLPGNFALRPRKAPITSRNFAAMSAFHNHPTGRQEGNHWGRALATLVTSARSPYHFSLHASDPNDPDGGSRQDTGHTFICGPTGSGKTVLIGFLITMLTGVGATQVVFDKDRGLEVLVRALGGEYLPLRHGLPTGFNPLQLAVTAGHIEFLKIWLRSLVCADGAHSLSVVEQADLDQALHGTLSLESEARRLSRLIEFLDPTDPRGLYARLAPWCQITHGDYAWAFDHERDLIADRVSGQSVIGWDVTEFLEHGRVRAPVTLYLFHLVRQLLDGRRLVCWMDEFWRLLDDPAFENFAKDGPKTWRKLNAVMCLATQSASDVLDSRISRTVIEQTPTKILFPNPDASLAEYTAGLGLSAREFELVRERLEPGSRRFLIKQGHHSVVCELDLKGFDAELSVISGRAEGLREMQRLVGEHGWEPGRWLTAFMEQANTGARA